MSSSTFARYSLRLTRFRAHHLMLLFALIPVLEVVIFAVFIHSASRLEKANSILDGLSAQLIAQPWSAGEPFALQSAWAGALGKFVDTINMCVREREVQLTSQLRRAGADRVRPSHGRHAPQQRCRRSSGASCSVR